MVLSIIGPQYNGGAGSGATILFNEKMVVNVGFPFSIGPNYGFGFGVGFDYLIGQYSITDFGSGGFVDFGWHWGVGGAARFYFTDGDYGWKDDRTRAYEGFGFAIGALPIIGLDLGLNINSSFKINFFLQYQPVLGLVINRPGTFTDHHGGYYEYSPVNFWFEYASCAVGVRFHF